MYKSPPGCLYIACTYVLRLPMFTLINSFIVVHYILQKRMHRDRRSSTETYVICLPITIYM